MAEEKKQPAISKEEYEFLAAFRYALRHFLRFSEKEARRVGVTPQQHQALLAIKGFPERDRVTVGELAEQLQIRHHSAVGLVNRLVAQDLVVREQAEEDRRQVYVTLTESGEELLRELAAAHKEELKRIEPQLHLLLDRLSGGDEAVMTVLEDEDTSSEPSGETSP